MRASLKPTLTAIPKASVMSVIVSVMMSVMSVGAGPRLCGFPFRQMLRD